MIPQMQIQKCGAKLCGTCPFLEETNYFLSNVTGIKYYPRTVDNSFLNCRSENVIYHIFLKICKFQYIGERKCKLQKRFSGHKSSINSNSSCQLVHKHFQEDFHGLSNCKIIPIEKININTLNLQNLDASAEDKAIS